MRNAWRFLVVCALAVVALPAVADQINLGDSTCSGGPIAISGTSVSGTAFSCSNDAFFSSTANGNIASNNSSWSYNPTTGVLTVSLASGADVLSGTVTWTASSGLFAGIDTLAGTINVTSVTGFFGEYFVGGNYNIDITFQGCTAGGGGVVNCTDPSAGEIPVPEPATLGLMGTGLFGLAGILRRRLFR